MAIFLRQAQNTFSGDLPDGFVVMDVRDGTYSTLNETASEIWRQLENPVSKEQIVIALRARFDITQEECERKTEDFLARLMERGFVEQV